jgi:hypothetical protein
VALLATEDKKTGWDRRKVLTNQIFLTLWLLRDVALNLKPTRALVIAILTTYVGSNRKVTNMSYKKAMERMIFKPLGMKHILCI